MLKTFLRAMLKPLSFLPAIGMMCLIYYLSGQDGVTSAGLSLKVSIKVVEIAAKVFDHALTTEEILYYADVIHLLIRKFAHMGLYFLLAVSVSFPLYVYGLRGIPLMIVAGDHANNDMAGDEEDSWKTVFTNAGYEVECVLTGLGQYEGVQQMIVAHAGEAMAK